MNEKRILTVQDISCVGQCSLTVALPILSACGHETCVLPSALLSAHTAFKHYSVLDLTDEMPRIRRAWEEEGITFDAIYTGYLGSARQVAAVQEVMASCLSEGALRIVDPAMADLGRLYPAFDEAFVSSMRLLCRSADILLPNITEACFLSETAYREQYDEAWIRSLLSRLHGAVGARTVVLTGVSYREDRTGVAVCDSEGQIDYYEHERLGRGCHGTGDVYASVFTGALLRGRTVREAAELAADFTVLCIKNTADDPNHWYGVRFEQLLPTLGRRLSGEE